MGPATAFWSIRSPRPLGGLRSRPEAGRVSRKTGPLWTRTHSLDRLIAWENPDLGRSAGSKVNDTTPRRVGDGVGAPNGIQKRGDVELGGVDRDAEPTDDHLV
jgi:hypothetical protein